MRSWMFTLMLCGHVAAAAAGVTTYYRWVDANGVTHYSDRPRPGAERIDLSPAQTYQASPRNMSAGTSAQPAATGAATRGDQTARSYARCEIGTPLDDVALVNVNSVSASVRLEPQLRAGDRVTMVLDGKAVQEPGSSTSFTLEPIHRGTHSLLARVEDAEGRLLCETPTIRFHVRQPSLLQPNRRAPTQPR